MERQEIVDKPFGVVLGPGLTVKPRGLTVMNTNMAYG